MRGGRGGTGGGGSGIFSGGRNVTLHPGGEETVDGLIEG